MTTAYRATMALILVLNTTVLIAEGSASWPAGDWKGVLQAGQQQLEIIYRLETGADGAWTGSMDVPAQGAVGLPLPSVHFDNGRLRIEMPLPGQAQFEGARAGEAIKGTFSQAGQSFPLTLERAAATAPPRRSHHHS